MAIVIGAGIRIGAGMAISSGDPIRSEGGSSAVTYTQGVDYSPAGVYGGSFPFSYMALNSSYWSNTVGRDLLLAQPAGTVYTVISNGNTYTFTTSATWSSGSVAGTYSPSPITEYVTSITFTPA